MMLDGWMAVRQQHMTEQIEDREYLLEANNRRHEHDKEQKGLAPVR